MKKLFVCGDSWLSPSVDTPGQHMAEIVADRLGYEMVPLSHGGMSNGGICVQIATAIDNRADCVLLGTTYVDRIEIPLVSDSFHTKWSTRDIKYNKTSSYLSARHPLNGTHTKIASGNILSLLEMHSDPIIASAVKSYFELMYSFDWKKQLDIWCMYAILHKLHLSGIPYVFVFDPMNVAPDCTWVNTPIIKMHEFYAISGVAISKVQDFRDPGYHTPPEAQQYAADLILEHIRANPRIFSSLGPDRSTSSP